MSSTKKLYLNGVFIADYESTGDERLDIAIARDILREKGLHVEISKQRAIFNQAHAFATTSSYLYKRDLRSVPRNGVTIVPFVVNSAFAIELYLKTVGLIHNKSLRGHDLLELYDQLPDVAKLDIERHLASSNWQCGVDTLAKYRIALEELRGAFVEWRYAFEGIASNTVTFDKLIYTMEVLHETCRTLLGIRGKSAS